MLPDGYRLTPLAAAHAPALALAYDRNREHLARWDPVRPPDFCTALGQAAVVQTQLRAQRAGLLDPWVLLDDDDRVVGRANIQNIVRGAMQGGTLGYWVDVDHLRRGLARAAVEFLVHRGLETGLHRLEAATVIDNAPSQAVLTACGFREYGLAPRFLFIAGEWRDHLLFQRVLHDDPPDPPGPPG